MSNYFPSLQEFVAPLAICQPETDLGNILSIFQHLNCKMLAIPQANLGWGIIYGSDLLSIITEAWLGDRIALTSHPRNIAYQPYRHNKTSHLMTEVKTLIKPVMVYQAETALDEFLHYLHRPPASLLNEEEPCLIVNQQGELVGRLDRDKIIQYLALNFSSVSCGKKSVPKQRQPQLNDQSARQIPAPDLDGLTDVLEAITVPSRIDTATLIQPPNSETSLENLLGTSAIVNHQLLGTVSHELKSPLTGIVGLSSLLQAQKLGDLNQRQGRYVELIYRSGKKMMAVVDDLLQLNAFMADPPQDSEVINLESFCCQLYQEVLTKIQSLEGKPNVSATLVQPELCLELDRQMAISQVRQSAKPSGKKSHEIRESLTVNANKLLLSSVLSHLMLEAIVGNETDEPLDIQIKSLSGMTAIVITGQAAPSMGNPGLNLTIAKCLAELLEAKITHACSQKSSSTMRTNCQFTLLFPPEVSPPEPMPSSKVEDPTLLSSTVTSHSKPSNLTGLTSPRIYSGNSPLTILCLYPELEVIDPQANHDHNSIFDTKNWADDYEAQTGYQHRIIEADSLEQAHNLARIWRLDAIILNGYQIMQPHLYLRSLQESSYLAALPLITLDTRTTEAANQIEGLNVYPCLLPAQQRHIADLIQVIQIAIES